MERYLLRKGYIYFSRGPALVGTVLGSSVSVFLWDTAKQQGGVNHYAWPWTQDRTRATPQYGNVAISALIRMLKDAGSRRRDLRAHIVGGGRPPGLKAPDLGSRNVQAARRMLGRKDVVIAAEDVGGLTGRKVVFDLRTGEVSVTHVRRIRATDWPAALLDDQH